MHFSIAASLPPLAAFAAPAARTMAAPATIMALQVSLTRICLSCCRADRGECGCHASSIRGIRTKRSIAGRRVPELLHGLIDGERARSLARRKLAEARNVLPHDRLRRQQHEGVLDEPAHIVARFTLGP